MNKEPDTSEQTRIPFARNSGPADPEDPRSGAQNRLGDLPTLAADVQRNSSGKPWGAVPGAAQTGTRGLDSRKLEGIRHRAACQILFAHPRRTAPAPLGGRQLDAALDGH